MKELDQPHIVRGMTAAMRYSVRYGVFLAVGLLLGLSMQNAQTFPDEMQTYFKQSVWQVNLSSGSGTAFFLNRHLLITNHHVVNPRDSDIVLIRNHDRSLMFEATVIKESEEVDLALLYCECKGYMAMIRPLGDFPAQGEELYSAGYGLGKHLSFAFGHAQGNKRDMPDFPADHFASVNTIMGDSGSPAINKKMEIVGVRNAVESAVVYGRAGPVRFPQSSHAIIIGAATLKRFLNHWTTPHKEETP